MRPGVQFSLLGVLPQDLSVRRVRILIPDLGGLPAVGYDPRLGTTVQAGLNVVNLIPAADSPARRAGRGGPRLGPYPGASVVLEVTDWQGRVERIPVRSR